jgi:hypothetical protein
MTTARTPATRPATPTTRCIACAPALQKHIVLHDSVAMRIKNQNIKEKKKVQKTHSKKSKQNRFFE